MKSRLMKKMVSLLLKGATVSELRNVNSYGTFECIVTKEGELVLVRVNNGSGLMYSNFSYENGDVVDITGGRVTIMESINVSHEWCQIL